MQGPRPPENQKGGQSFYKQFRAPADAGRHALQRSKSIGIPGYIKHQRQLNGH